MIEKEIVKLEELFALVKAQENMLKSLKNIVYKLYQIFVWNKERTICLVNVFENTEKYICYVSLFRNVT